MSIERMVDLIACVKKQERTVPGLVDLIGMDTYTVRTYLKAMECEGLVERTNNPYELGLPGRRPDVWRWVP